MLHASRVGSIRRPCEYYLSLWAFGSAGKGNFRGLLLHHHGRNLSDIYGPKINVKMAQFAGCAAVGL